MRWRTGWSSPAHDYVLRCSHTFNLLDARGAIGVTERAHFFARMRDLARQVSMAYFEQRQHEEFPWLIEDDRLQIEDSAPAGTAIVDLRTFNLQSSTCNLSPRDRHRGAAGGRPGRRDPATRRPACRSCWPTCG